MFRVTSATITVTEDAAASTLTLNPAGTAAIVTVTTGPTGPTGATGATGPAGPTGDTGTGKGGAEQALAAVKAAGRVLSGRDDSESEVEEDEEEAICCGEKARQALGNPDDRTKTAAAAETEDFMMAFNNSEEFSRGWNGDTTNEEERIA